MHLSIYSSIHLPSTPSIDNIIPSRTIHLIIHPSIHHIIPSPIHPSIIFAPSIHPSIYHPPIDHIIRSTVLHPSIHSSPSPHASIHPSIHRSYHTFTHGSISLFRSSVPRCSSIVSTNRYLLTPCPPLSSRRKSNFLLRLRSSFLLCRDR